MSDLKTRILFKLPDGSFASRAAASLPDVPRRGDECHVLGKTYVVESRRFYVGPENGAQQLLDAIGAGSNILTGGNTDAAASLGSIRNLDPVTSDKPGIEIASALAAAEEIILIVLTSKARQSPAPVLGAGRDRLSLALGAAIVESDARGPAVSQADGFADDAES